MASRTFDNYYPYFIILFHLIHFAVKILYVAGSIVT